jgi:lysyl-tRNA synthetase class 2
MDEVEALLVDLAARHQPAGRLAAQPYGRLTHADAFRRGAGVDPHRDGVEALRRACGDGAPALDDADREGWLTWLQASRVEPQLGVARPEFVHLYPADQCALARVRAGDPPVAERFELYCGGVELANGFGELNDPVEQRERIESENRARGADGRDRYPVDETFLAELGRMPAGAGVALGVDRVVMLLLGVRDLDAVMAFPGALDDPVS